MDTVDLYNSATGVWSTAQLSVARSIPRNAATSVGNVAMFGGGRVVDLYNGATGAWATTESFGSFVAATSVGNVALFAGGHTCARAHAHLPKFAYGTLLLFGCPATALTLLFTAC